MTKETTLKKAEFNPKVCNYWLVSVALTCVFTIVGLPFLLIWFPIGLSLTRRYLKSMECTLTNKTLKVNKGMLVRTEKTIPLEKITDVGMVQGPIMRHFGVHTLTVETAGQSAQGALVSLTGIVDAKLFREAILKQRDVISSATPAVTSEVSHQESTDTNSLLVEIRDSLNRIETKLDQKH